MAEAGSAASMFFSLTYQRLSIVSSKVVQSVRCAETSWPGFCCESVVSLLAVSSEVVLSSQRCERQLQPVGSAPDS